MHPHPRRNPTARFVGLALSLILVTPCLLGAETRPDGEERPAVPRTVTVGKATLNWHLAPARTVNRAELVEALARATRAHIEGTERVESPQAAPRKLPDGRLVLRLPPEMMHAMFADGEGHEYCSDSTVVRSSRRASRSDGGSR